MIFCLLRKYLEELIAKIYCKTNFRVATTKLNGIYHFRSPKTGFSYNLGNIIYWNIKGDLLTVMHSKNKSSTMGPDGLLPALLKCGEVHNRSEETSILFSFLSQVSKCDLDAVALLVHCQS